MKEAPLRRGSVVCHVYEGTDGCTRVASGRRRDDISGLHTGYPRSWPATIDPEEVHLKGTIHGRLATLVTWLGVLALVVGMGLGGELEAGWRQVCTQSCDHASGEEYWQCRRGHGAVSSCEKVWFESHGAIAYSRETGAYGYAYDHDNQNRARHAALRHCTRHASDCHIVVTFVEQCGAIAETTQREVSPGLGKTRKEAEERSLAACRAAAGKACTVAAWVCSK